VKIIDQIADFFLGKKSNINQMHPTRNRLLFQVSFQHPKADFVSPRGIFNCFSRKNYKKDSPIMNTPGMEVLMNKNANHIFKNYLVAIILLMGIVIVNFCCGSSSLQQNQNAEFTNLAHSVERQTYEKGKKLWFNPNNGGNGPNCESCHLNGNMTNAETYPRYKHILKTMATISMTHNFAVVNESKGNAWELGSEDANAIALFVTSFANGKKLRMAPPEEYNEEWTKNGRTIFKSEQLSKNGKSCENCHSEVIKRKDNNAIPQKSLKGITAIYPKFSQQYNRVITIEQQINNCIESNLEGSALPLDSDEIISLCCYLASLSEGKKVSVAQFKN
jgi:cytochrome c